MALAWRRSAASGTRCSCRKRGKALTSAHSTRAQEKRAVRTAIIGGGVAGLTAAYELAGAGSAQVHVFENGPELGGLASGFKGRASW
ncbi:MAG: FAD-dependent oxidoreductase, partial [Caldilineaceae bacterium SB0670_bin_27]|nr:FAD-dependent oxidoreductase [Caldilineaceae bacterium SB0670_bin_27]